MGRELPLLENMVRGKIPGQTRKDQITMLRNGSGIGIQFAAVAAKAYEHAKKLNYGREIADRLVHTSRQYLMVR